MSQFERCYPGVERAANAFRKMTPGTMGGQSRTPTPVAPPFENPPPEEEGGEWVWQVTSLVDQIVLADDGIAHGMVAFGSNVIGALWETRTDVDDLQDLTYQTVAYTRDELSLAGSATILVAGSTTGNSGNNTVAMRGQLFTSDWGMGVISQSDNLAGTWHDYVVEFNTNTASVLYDFVDDLAFPEGNEFGIMLTGERFFGASVEPGATGWSFAHGSQFAGGKWNHTLDVQIEAWPAVNQDGNSLGVFTDPFVDVEVVPLDSERVVYFTLQTSGSGMSYYVQVARITTNTSGAYVMDVSNARDVFGSFDGGAPLTLTTTDTSASPTVSGLFHGPLIPMGEPQGDGTILIATQDTLYWVMPPASGISSLTVDRSRATGITPTEIAGLGRQISEFGRASAARVTDDLWFSRLGVFEADGTGMVRKEWDDGIGAWNHDPDLIVDMPDGGRFWMTMPGETDRFLAIGPLSIDSMGNPTGTGSTTTSTYATNPQVVVEIHKWPEGEWVFVEDD